MRLIISIMDVLINKPLCLDVDALFRNERKVRGQCKES